MFGERLENVRRRQPLIHTITNFVTVNDCANILLACGGSPIMSDDPSEVEEITSLADGLTLNLGTLHQWAVPSFFAAGRRANALGHPVVLDPVGAGTATVRTNTALSLLKEVRFAGIRCNLSEIRALALGTGSTRGVDADAAGSVTEDNLAQVVSLVRGFAADAGSVVAVTGAIDVVSDGTTAYGITNGHPMMRSVTGTGCQLSALTAAYIAANQDNPCEAAAAAVCAMGVCGEIAYSRLGPMDGTGSFRMYLLDAISRLDGETLDRMAKVRMF